MLTVQKLKDVFYYPVKNNLEYFDLSPEYENLSEEDAIEKALNSFITEDFVKTINENAKSLPIIVFDDIRSEYIQELDKFLQEYNIDSKTIPILINKPIYELCYFDEKATEITFHTTSTESIMLCIDLDGNLYAIKSQMLHFAKEDFTIFINQLTNSSMFESQDWFDSFYYSIIEKS